MQPLVIVYYLMTLVCDLNAHLRGKVTWCVPLTFSFTGVNKNYLTRFINTMPTDKNTMPADKNTMPADKVRKVTLASDFFVKLYSRDNFSIV